MPEVIYKFNLPEESYEFEILCNAQKMFSILWDIREKCRQIRKYEQSPHEERLKLANEIDEMIYENIDLYDMK